MGMDLDGTKVSARFFESTRGRIVTLLRDSPGTVNELVDHLGLTDNAVRAHLLALEQDGLVKQSGIQPGVRKPHFIYALTPQAEALFPKAYDLLLNELIGVLKSRLAADEVQGILQQLGQSLAARQTLKKRSSRDSRARSAVNALAALGGVAKLETHQGQMMILSESCPLSAAVAEHPEICQLAEALIAEVVGLPVQERCNREGAPKCRFEIRDQK